MSFSPALEDPTESPASPPCASTSAKRRAKPAAKAVQKEESVEAAEAAAEVSLASVRPGVPLIDSYTYHSVDSVESDPTLEGTKRKREEDEQDELKNKKRREEMEWMLGVDEAGRGPVLGPQVYGIAFCPVPYLDDLKALGFADSKTLTAESREHLLQVMIEHSSDIKWSVRVMSPHDLSRGMLKKSPYNLNAQSHDATIQLIQDVVQRGYNLTQVFVDTVGPAAAYQAKLQALFPTLDFTVCSKADSIYPIVSAASIAAKVTRDKVLDDWCFLEKGWERQDGAEGGGERNWGSGYPSDPNTIAWIANNVDSIFGYPNIARFSWQTVKTVLGKSAADVRWNDEPATIQKYFSPAALAASQESSQNGVWKDFNLTSASSM